MPVMGHPLGAFISSRADGHRSAPPATATPPARGGRRSSPPRCAGSPSRGRSSPPAACVQAAREYSGLDDRGLRAIETPERSMGRARQLPAVDAGTYVVVLPTRHFDLHVSKRLREPDAANGLRRDRRPAPAPGMEAGEDPHVVGVVDHGLAAAEDIVQGSGGTERRDQVEIGLAAHAHGRQVRRSGGVQRGDDGLSDHSSAAPRTDTPHSSSLSCR